MNHAYALTKLAQLEKETAELRAIFEKPESAGSLLTKPIPGSDTPYWTVESEGASGFGVGEQRKARNQVFNAYCGGNIFQSEAIARDYAEAIDTMLLLRHQPGTVAVSTISQYVIETDSAGNKLYVEDWQTSGCKYRLISPCFSTEELAQTAIDNIGKERILRMFKTFHGIYE